MPRLAMSMDCTGCSACANICPQKCITMAPDAEGFLHPVISEENCIHCNLCMTACPILQPLPGNTFPVEAYAAICTQDKIRMQSTSGGVFSMLAQWIFSKGGIVYGAVYGKDFSVCHRAAESEEELTAIRTAKYAQSVMGDVFARVKAQLNEGRFVLFSGTPCQVGGLQAYLKKSYEHLILVDVVCHGVPSPAVWQHYISYRVQQDAPDSRVRFINLRSKETGWPGYSIRFDYENGSVYTALNSKDPFLRGFVGDYYLRPSCHHCAFKGLSRNSDFTLADYWGVENQLPEYHDGKGTSLVMLHSAKAQKIWADIQPDLRCCAVEPETVLEWNPSALVCSCAPENREIFWNRYQTEDFQALISELMPLPPQQKTMLGVRVLRKIKSILQGK